MFLWNEALLFLWPFPCPTALSNNPRIPRSCSGSATLTDSSRLCFRAGSPVQTLAQAGGFKKRGGIWVKRILKTLPYFHPSWKIIHHHSMAKSSDKVCKKETVLGRVYLGVNSDVPCPKGCISVVPRREHSGKRTGGSGSQSPKRDHWGYKWGTPVATTETLVYVSLMSNTCFLKICLYRVCNLWDDQGGLSPKVS